MSQLHAPIHDEIEKLITSMAEDEQRIALAFLIMYSAAHPEILTKTARKELEAFANSTASIIEED